MSGSNSKPLRRAVFLDRDGTLNEDSPAYVKSVAELKIFPDAGPGLRRMHGLGFALVVVTNQSALARGLTTLEELGRMHAHLRDALAAAGAPILDFLFCPHAPDEGCSCRKPLPGLIEEACRRHGIDARGSFLVGDRESDVLAGARAGCRTILLARAGAAPPAGARADHVARDLVEAAGIVAASEEKRSENAAT